MLDGTGGGSTENGPPWELRYARRLAITDLLVVVWAVVGAQLARFGVGSSEVVFRQTSRQEVEVSLSYTALSVILVVAWMATLGVAGTRDARVVGAGSAEYRRIVDGTLRLFGVLAIIAFLFHIDVARSYLLLAFPIGLVALLASRWGWRQWLVGQRRKGEFASSVVLVGSYETVAAVAHDLAREPGAGYRLAAAIAPGSNPSLPGSAVPLSHDLDRVVETMERYRADTVIVASGDDFPPRRIRELSWALEPGRQHLVLAPGLTDVGGPRIHTRPVAGLPLMHVEVPRYEGFKRFAKRSFDILGSATLLVLLLPFLIVIAVAIRRGSAGPALFRQSRIGFGGRPFTMLKFRSMVVDAEAQREALERAGLNAGNEVLFKLRDDPRVTPVGRFLRRYSLDELPQLVNVLTGTMSLVGPRPPLAEEVSHYETHVHRRFLVKPGVTGLWQVSGRSDLDWEDSVRLDLYYVENWSITSDVVILWRTLRAVLRRIGAY